MSGVEYYLGFDASVKDEVQDFRYQQILESEGLGHLDRCSKEGQEALEGWGFCSPSWFQDNNEELLRHPGDLIHGRRVKESGGAWEEVDDGEISISKSHPALKVLLNEISPDGYFDEEVERISREEFYEKMKTKADYAVYVCELEPPC
jgi:hypothetical protein